MKVLIDDWRSAWKLYSVKIGILGTVLLGVLAEAPEYLGATWNLLPDSIKNGMPPDMVAYLAMGITILMTISRVIKQVDTATSKEGPVDLGALREGVEKELKDSTESVKSLDEALDIENINKGKDNHSG